MKSKFLCCAAAASAVVGLTGCVDDKYDLSDIDTTTRIQVNDLVLPVNIDAVTLSDIITFDEDSKIKPVKIGDKEFYAFSDEGTFDSKDIFIEKVTADAPVLNPTERDLDQVQAENDARRRAGSVADDYSCQYNVVEMGNDFSYHAEDVDKSIVELVSAKVDPMTFKVHLQALNVDGKVDRMFFKDMRIQMPYGLTIDHDLTSGAYDPVSGIWTINMQDVVGNLADAQLVATAINFKDNGCHIENSQLFFDGQFRVKSGVLTINPKKDANGVPMPLPEKLKFRVSYSIDDMTVNAFTGKVHYTLEGMDIDPVSLSDIPDFLAGDETVISLANPQIYLNVNNPVSSDKLNCETGLTLTAFRDGQAPLSYSLNNQSFTIPYSEGANPDVAKMNFVLTPTAESDEWTIPSAYVSPAPKYVPFTNLSYILGGDPAAPQVKGLPKTIGISLVDPCIPESDVEDFEIGRTIPGIDGKYELIAPLALEKGSVIVYTDTEDGWNDEDVDALTITAMEVSATATNGCPVNVTLSGDVLGVDGKPIPGVKLSSTELAAGQTSDIVIKLETTGDAVVTHLDGVTFRATVVSESPETLSPAQTITLEHIRARVSGYYEKEF